MCCVCRGRHCLVVVVFVVVVVIVVDVFVFVSASSSSSSRRRCCSCACGDYGCVFDYGATVTMACVLGRGRSWRKTLVCEILGNRLWQEYFARRYAPSICRLSI